MDLTCGVEALMQDQKKIWTLTRRTLRQVLHLIMRNERLGAHSAETAGVVVLGPNTSPLDDAVAHRMGA